MNTKGLCVVRSIEMTQSMLVSTNVADNDHPIFNVGTTYADGERVLFGTSIYESIQANNTGNWPEAAADWWARVSPMNRWKPFDLSSTTRLRITEQSFYKIRPGTAVSAVMLLDCAGLSTVRIRLIEGGVTHYDSEHLMRPVPSSSSWYAWTFEQRAPRSRLVVQDLPARPRATLRVDLKPAGSEAFVGTLAFGRAYEVGHAVRHGARVGVQDFSRKERNEYGEMELLRRGNAKTLSLQIMVPNEHLDSTDQLLTQITGVPCLWIASQKYQALSIWGVFTNWNYVVSYPDMTELSVEVEAFV